MEKALSLLPAYGYECSRATRLTTTLEAGEQVSLLCCGFCILSRWQGDKAEGTIDDAM